MKYLKSIYEFVVPMGIGFDKWKDMQKNGMTAKKYHEDHPGKKFKIVHGHKEGEIGKPLPGAINLSYTKASKQHKAIVLNEKLGVPDEIDPWIDLLYSFVISQIYLFKENVSNSDIYDTQAEIGGVNFKTKSMIIEVKDGEFDKYIKNHIPKDNKMKIKNLQINLEISTIPDNMFTFDPWNAAFIDSDSKVEDGIYTNVGLDFDIFIPESILSLEKKDINKLFDKMGISRKIIGLLSHELTHMYEYYQRELSKSGIWKDRLLNTNKFIAEQEVLANISDDWKEFLRLIYLSLDFEINARISQLFYSLVELEPKTKQEFFEYVKQNSVWDEMVSLKNFNAEEFYNNFSYKSSDDDIKDAFLELGIYSKEELENSDIKHLIIKELVKMWDKNIDQTNELYKDGGMSKLSKHTLNNPKSFLGVFENRFHSKAKTWERKIFRLSSRFNLENS